ncbi:arylesterase [Litoribacter alkaliphilus]|uniref:Arylesterase n=1 Tax=Litoribacter ruber TaxID=702568 RepID=A0AAP2G1K6_9BACT|nr:arylesterase [Litoribacter alkaliphilus]MBS9524302.1 arylesterase [Litoribacter alkaliphilus]
MNTIKPLYILLIYLFTIPGCGPQEQQSQQGEVTTSAVERTIKEERKTILFFGNSLTAGYGIDEDEAFPGLIQNKIDSLDLPYKVINGGLSGETSASGINRLEWFLEEEPSIFVLELGGNDGLRGIAVEETRKNLETMIEMVRKKYPDTRILLAGMQIPPNMGREYAANFELMYKEIAVEKNVKLIPFLLEGVGGVRGLNLPDGIHPTEEGHRIVAETVWEYLEPMIN